MEKLLIKNIDYIYCMDEEDRIFQNADIYIKANQIEKLGKALCCEEGTRIIDGRGKIAFPGFVNAHHHFYQNITRNVPIMQKGYLLDWLMYSYAAWEFIGEEEIRAAARLSAAELLLTGVTTSMDFMYFFPCGQHRLMDTEFEAVAELGLRFHGFRGCMPVMEGALPKKLYAMDIDSENLIEKESDILDDCARMFDKYHDNSEYAMTRVGVGPTTIVLENPEFMMALKKMADEKGGLLHTHLHPRPDEMEKCAKLYGCTPNEWLQRIGWLDRNVSVAHISRHTEADLKILAECRTSATQSPSCHMRLGYPVAPAPEAVKAGVNVALGVDGGASNDSGDMLGELRGMLYVHRIQGAHKEYEPKDWFNAKDVFGMATANGAKLLNRNDIGELAPKKAADIVLFPIRTIAYAGGMADPRGALLYCGNQHIADTTIVNGKVVVEEGRLVNADENEIIQDADRAAAHILDKVQEKTGIDYRKLL